MGKCFIFFCLVFLLIFLPGFHGFLFLCLFSLSTHLVVIPMLLNDQRLQRFYLLELQAYWSYRGYSFPWHVYLWGSKDKGSCLILDSELCCAFVSYPFLYLPISHLGIFFCWVDEFTKWWKFEEARQACWIGGGVLASWIVLGSCTFCTPLALMWCCS